MTSNKQIPVLSDDIKEKTVEGIYKVDLPKIVEYEMPMGDKKVPSLQFRCQSLYARKPNEICCCNSVVKTAIGGGTGDQTELIECGKCRTSYIIRTQYNDEGHMAIKATVWDTGRNVKAFCNAKRDKDYNIWVEFNKED